MDGDRPAQKAGLFFGLGLIRTVACIEKVSSVRIVSGGANAAAQKRTKRRKNMPPTNTNMIRIRLKAYDRQLIDQAAETTVEAAKRTDA